VKSEICSPDTVVILLKKYFMKTLICFENIQIVMMQVNLIPNLWRGLFFSRLEREMGFDIFPAIFPGYQEPADIPLPGFHGCARF
jgi:hypothetical protein